MFPTRSPTDYLEPEHPALLELAKGHLEHFNLLGKKTQIGEPINIPGLPDLVGKNTLDEHFTRIGNRYSQPYLTMAEEMFEENAKLPPKPQKWSFQSGWTRYIPGEEPQPVEFPLEDELVFDVEVMYKRAPYAVLCTAASPIAWYGWVSPLLTEYAKDSSYDNWEHLIPFDTQNKPKLLVGYNVSYDRARVLEEYSIKQSKAFYLDGMALHIALAGICSQQRPAWHKHKKHKKIVEEEEEIDEFSEDAESGLSASDVAQELMDDPWLNKGSPNSLANVAEFHCGLKLPKGLRDTFSSLDVNDVTSNFQELMDYCAGDVDATYAVVKKLFPQFRERNPHPVSFAALRQLGTLFLPTTRKWDKYVENAERVYEENRKLVFTILEERAKELVRFISENDAKLTPDYENDPWLKQLNWVLKEVRLRKDGTPFANLAYLTGYPEWYRELFKIVVNKDGEKAREMNLTVRTRITPLLLRLKWEGYPLIWTDSAGWCFKVPYEDKLVEDMLAKNYTKAHLSEEDFERMLPELRDTGTIYELFKVPHPEGPKKRCTLVMSKSYLRFFENGVLTSEYEYAKEILNLNAHASYWMGNRGRILDQFVVYADTKAEKNKFFDTKKDIKSHKDMGIIIPKLCAMGTVTRRATENTWLTASNAKANRIGSELKSMIEVPEGYAFVGADVDSEELWIASLIGDSMFKMHGATALGWMTLEGEKSEKTDLHSKTAEIMGILRNDAKVFNYGRIYGAGVRFTTRLLKQCNASLSDVEAERIARELYEQTKGQVSNSRIFKRRIYHGGTESLMFNALESIANQENPRTPVLGASITDALTQRYLNKNSYLTSRINWTIQSSGVDYLHLLIISMEYLIDKFKINARLMITVHDELRYMVKEDQKLMCALLLQISNLWTRSMFCEQMGIKELPQSCAFFSEVDIDHVLRKEVGMDCITPSHPESIRPGESYDIHKLLEAINAEEALKSKSNSLLHLKMHKYELREPVIARLDGDLSAELKIAKLRLQNSTDKETWKKNVGLYMQIGRDAERESLHDALNVPENPLARRRLRKVDSEEYNLSSDGNDSLQKAVENAWLTQPAKGSSLKTGFSARKLTLTALKTGATKMTGAKIAGTKTASTNPVTRLKSPSKVESTAKKVATTKASVLRGSSISTKKTTMMNPVKSSVSKKTSALTAEPVTPKASSSVEKVTSTKLLARNATSKPATEVRASTKKTTAFFSLKPATRFAPAKSSIYRIPLKFPVPIPPITGLTNKSEVIPVIPAAQSKAKGLTKSQGSRFPYLFSANFSTAQAQRVPPKKSQLVPSMITSVKDQVTYPKYEPGTVSLTSAMQPQRKANIFGFNRSKNYHTSTICQEDDNFERLSRTELKQVDPDGRRRCPPDYLKH